jgi:hypothetical protein
MNLKQQKRPSKANHCNHHVGLPPMMRLLSIAGVVARISSFPHFANVKEEQLLKTPFGAFMRRVL